MTQDSVLLDFPVLDTPAKAMILAAGLGTRMRPITDTMPKPLVRVYGKALLDHALDAVRRAGVKDVVVNVHYHADQIVRHLETVSDLNVEISDERDGLLDSAGGIIKALPKLGDQPFYLLNADSFWVEGFKPNLLRMAALWDRKQMDILLLLAGMSTAVGFGSKGDFHMNADARLTRRGEGEVAAFAYSGAAILDPKIFADTAAGISSINRQFDEAIEHQRLFGLPLEGLWLHVGTPDAIREAEEAIARSAA
ncbi:MAG: nucleotidyltransferase family protein [Pseudomonadota bacterium]